MSVKERRRLEIFGRVERGEMTLHEAADLLDLSYRQARRVRQRYTQQGDAGLVHQLRGRTSNRRTDEAVRLQVLKIYRASYPDFGVTLACEYLEKAHKIAVGRETLRRWLKAEGLLVPRRQRPKHRTRRTRRPHRGELVQMDGSWHDWFEGRDAWCCLMVMVDDATGEVFAWFYEKETQAAAFDIFGRYAQAYGLPQALYVDRAATYRSDREPTAQELVDEQKPVTQFGRAMRELDVELILANSPQAKGRVERQNATLQDRLVKAMRLAGISTIEAANAFLAGTASNSKPQAPTVGFLAELNEKFSVEPGKKADVHREVKTDLSEVLCVQEERVVGRDWCVQWQGRFLQIDKAHERLALATKRVTVREKADGTLGLLWEGQHLTWQEVKERPKRQREKKPVVNNKKWVPPADHPWKARPSCGSPAVVARTGSAAPHPPLPPPPDNGTVLLG